MSSNRNSSQGLPPLPEKKEAADNEVVLADKPKASNELEDNSKVKTPATVKGGIDVIALRKGYFRMSRKSEGDRFKIASLEQYGSWMKCIDPEMEKKARAFLEAKYSKKTAGK